MFKFPWKNRPPKTGKTKGDLIIELNRSPLELDPADIPLGSQTKRCPKCNRVFDVKAIICHVDSTLLMLVQSTDAKLDQPITATCKDGKTFEVLCKRSIGNGTLCEVFDAENTATQQRHAVKLLSSNLVWDTKSAKRFIKGGEIALSLEHENIVRVHGVGTLKSQKGKSLPFMVCEYLEGRQLNELITKDSLPSVHQVLDIFEQVCFALEYAHAQEITHGDLKPTNICLVEEGEKTIVKVADFAVAERLFRDLEWDKVATMTTSIYGCSTYLSPDFMDVRVPTPTSDIYSVGCMMYECLTGTPPFTEGNDFAIILAHRDTPPRPFAAEYTPKDVAALVMKALEKDPRKRWQSAAEMRDAIVKAKSALAASNEKLLTRKTDSGDAETSDKGKAMFSFFRKNDQPSDTSTSRVGVTAADMPGIKICPKCNRLYRPKTVVCIYDESFLHEKNPPPKEQQPISSVTAMREDDSKWTLLTNKPLGTGSLCAVYEAIDTKGGKPVVVKILQSHLMNDRKAERRFLEGAKLALPLVHENIIRQLATGAYVDTLHKVARPLTVFEYIEGKQLSKLLDEENLPTASDTLSIASDVCFALQYAHESGVIHGDLKPSNIFLQEVGDRVIAKVCDFAIAERLFSGLEWERVTTMTCSLYGSATYLAPDYANSRQLSTVADLYSLGCIMYECLVGFPPFHGANDFMTIMQHMNEAPKALAATDTPQVVSDIIMKALAKDPNERWQSAEQMNVAIKIAQKKLGIA